ncbi:MAG: SusC/RagA family TonB-linked outer membrane protein [Cyclobacteriaceae bacterium]
MAFPDSVGAEAGKYHSNENLMFINTKPYKDMYEKILPQKLLIMSKYAIYCMILHSILFSMAFANSGEAQSKKLTEIYITLNVKSSLEEVLSEISEKSDFNFVYNDFNVKKQTEVSLKSRNKSMSDILMRLSKDYGLRFKRVDNNIFVNGVKDQNLRIEELVQDELSAEIEITGKITDENGDGLPGASIVVKGTTNGTTSDMSGSFRLNVPEDATLVVSFVGYETIETPVSNRSVIDVTLSPDATQLAELVVLGYSTTTRRDVTGSIASLSSAEINRTPITDVSQALQGKLPGVRVTSQDGRPGAEVNIRVRGGGSITGSNQPYFIVDGFPVNSISNIPANQIESIDVLKEASATAIYGNRGANGVIIITTKSGTPGKTTVSYDGYTQWNTVPNYLDVMNGYDYIAFNWAYASAIGDQYADAWERLWAIGRHEGSNTQGIDFYRNVDSRDFTKELYNGSFTHSHNFSIASGNANTKYVVALNHIDEEGMKVGSHYTRTNFQFKLDQNLGDKLSLQFNTRFAQVNTGDNSGDSEAYWFRPIATSDVLGDMDITSNTQLGDYNGILQDEFNPVAVINDQVRDRLERQLVANTGLTYDILEGLSAKSNLSLGTTWYTQKDWDGAIASNYINSATGEKTFGGDAMVRNVQRWNYRWNNLLLYDVQGLGSSHKLDILFGIELARRAGETFQMNSDRFPATYDSERAFANMGSYDRSDATDRGVPTSSYEPSYSSLSYFGKANYSLLDKYLFSATFRADASSNFSPENRWGFFPAAAVGWRLSNEAFLQDITWVSDLKLRASYGTVGNDNITANLWKQGYQAGTTQFSVNEQVQSHYKPTNSDLLANKNLVWETTTTRNLGLDYSVLGGKLYGTIDVYKNTVSDLLVYTSVTSLTGYSLIQDNVGATSNRGVEFSLGAEILNTNKFKLNGSFNINFNKNNVDELDEGVTGYYRSNFGGVRLAPSTGDYFLTEGQPVGLYRGWIHEGMYTTDDFNYDPNTETYTLKQGVADLASGLLPNIYGTFSNKPGTQTAYPGVQKIKDLNGDGIIDEEDITVIGNANPKHAGGFNINGSFMSLDFNMDFVYSYGNDIFNATHVQAYLGNKESGLFRNRFQELAGHYKIYDIENGQLTKVVDPAELDALNANATTYLPYPESAMNTTFGIEDGSFLRLQTITLGYSLPESLLSKVGMSRFRIYGSIFNALTITGYKGMDPEVSVDDDSNDFFPTPGLDLGTYPRARRFTLGVNLQF